LEYKSFQESRRETWKLGDAEIVLDEWPWLDPYVEIEGPSESTVKDAAATLGFNWTDAIFGRVTELYQLQYPSGDADKLVTIPRLTFNDPLPEIISGQKAK
jgi:adenylate cyclase class 2